MKCFIIYNFPSSNTGLFIFKSSLKMSKICKNISILSLEKWWFERLTTCLRFLCCSIDSTASTLTMLLNVHGVSLSHSSSPHLTKENTRQHPYRISSTNTSSNFASKCKFLCQCRFVACFFVTMILEIKFFIRIIELRNYDTQHLF